MTTSRPTDSTAFEQTEACTEPLEEPALQPRRPAGLQHHLPLWQMVLALAWWPMLEQLLTAMVGLVDTALAGRLDPAATEAVGSSGYVLWLLGMMQGAVGVGATAVIARAVGGDRKAEADHALGQAIFLAVVWGVVNLALVWLAAPWIGRFTSLEGPALELCILYLRMLALVAPCRAVLFIGAACLRGAGDTRTPFFVMLVINLVNVCVSVALVADFSPVGGHGLRGVAIGTMVAWVIGSAIMVRVLLRGRGGVRLRLAEARPDWPMVRRIVRITIPTLVEQTGHWTGNLLVIVIVGSLADLGLADRPMGSQIIGIRIEAFSFLLGFGFSIATSTIVGQYLGVGDERGARRGTWMALAYAMSIMVTFGIVFMVWPGPLVRIFTDQEPFLSDVPALLFHAGWGQVGFAMYLVFAGALRGAGATRTTMLITFTSTFLVRLPLAWFVGIYLGYGLPGIWAMLALELTVRGLLFFERFMRGNWAQVKV